MQLTINDYNPIIHSPISTSAAWLCPFRSASGQIQRKESNAEQTDADGVKY